MISQQCKEDKGSPKHRDWFGLGCIFLLLFISSLGMYSCKHEPFLADDDEFIPIDTTIVSPVDTSTNMPDTTQVANPCDSNLVYFQAQILPILISSCGISGCHTEDSAQEGVVLTSYSSVLQTTELVPYDLEESDLYEVLVEDRLDKRMPPSPRNPLSTSQINLIAKWILQGATDQNCNPLAQECDTTNISYSTYVQPVLQDHCIGCHSGGSPSGNVNLDSYEGIKTVAEDGRLYGVISWMEGFPNMPRGGAKLPDCAIDKIKAWIEAGAVEN